MTESEETAYLQGNRMAYVGMLILCLKHLGYDELETKSAAWVIERESAIHTLRSACRIHGDNDWPDDLDLSDIIDNHLVDYLDEPETTETNQNDKESWLNGWPRSGKNVIMGNSLCCCGCGKFQGVISVAVEGKLLLTKESPDFPFKENDCPLCR